MIKKIQSFVGDFKITTTNAFYYLSEDGVSKFKSEEEHDKLMGSDNLNYNFRYKKCFSELKDMLVTQQNDHEWFKEALEMVENYEN